MIYEFKVVNSNGKPKDMFLTADSVNAFYRRAIEMYSLCRDEIILVAEYEEVPNFGYKLKKSFVKIEKKKDKKVLDKALTVFKQANDRSKRMVEPRKSDYIERHKFSSCPISTVDDVADLMSKYKTVKVYWENGTKRGEHALYACYK